MEKSVLDDYCKSIFLVLFSAEKPLGFNALDRKINALGAKMTRPTLNAHLKHLLRRKLITKKKEGKQSVAYAVNLAFGQSMRSFYVNMKVKQHIEHILGEEKRFKSFPIRNQVMYVAFLIELRELWRLKLRILHAIDPSKNFQYNIEFILTSRYFNHFKHWLLEDCRSSPTKDASEALSMLDECIEVLKNELFKNPPKDLFRKSEQTTTKGNRA
jgi:DNA-binding HxlR family transcriptional regulator